MKFMNVDKFHRYLWYDPISKDINICNPKRMAKIAQEVHATAVHYVATVPYTGKMSYPSKFRPMEPFTGGKDLLGEMVKECHKRDIKCIAYFNAHWVSKDNLPADKDWLVVLRTGEVLDMAIWYGAGFCPCVNSPHFLKASVDLCVEMTEKYDIDGIFFDGPTFLVGTCYCKFCQEKFKKLYNAEMPREEMWGNPVWENFIKFRLNSIAEYLDTVRSEVKKIRNIPIYKNGAPLKITWFNAIGSESLAPQSDLIGGEHFVFYSDPFNTPVWGAGAVAKYHYAIAENEKPAIVYGCYAHKVWDFYPLPENDMKNIIAETVANCAYPFVTVDDYLTVNDKTNLAPIKEMYSFIEKNEKYYLDAKPYNNVGLYWSQYSADFYTRGKLKGAGGTHHIETISEKEYEKEFEGFYDLFTQGHIPFDIIVEKGMELEKIKKYDCLVLPNFAGMTEKDADILRTYVKEGGCIIATNETSLYNELGHIREDFLISDLLGITAGTKIQNEEDRKKIIWETKIDYMTPASSGKSHPILKTADRKYIPVALENVKIKMIGNAKAVMYFMNPLAFRYDSLKGVSEYPGVVVNTYGKGKVVYFAGNVGALYRTYNIRDIRDIVCDAINWMVDIPLKIEDNYTLDTNLTQAKDGSILLHVINWSTRIKRPVDTVVPVRDLKIKIKLKEKPKSVKTLWSKKQLKFKKAGAFIEFTIPEIKNYEVVVIK